ncbi:MAG: hypothetical protein ACLFUJ_01275 [Phycisphaerae bacterium]
MHEPSTEELQALLAVSNDIWIGVALLIFALSANVALVLWSRRTIEKIKDMPGRSARQIERHLNGD